VTGGNIILCIKNHAAGDTQRIGELVEAILKNILILIIHYHGHNTDGADIGRIVSAVRKRCKNRRCQ